MARSGVEEERSGRSLPDVGERSETTLMDGQIHWRVNK